MKKLAIKVTVAAVAFAIPAIALGATSTYKGDGTGDPTAKITLRVSGGGDNREITQIIANKIEYVNGETNCEKDGRTPRVKIEGPFNVSDNGRFRAVAQATTGLGELRVSEGELRAQKAIGKMRFTFGKNGCRTTNTLWKAERQ